MNEKLKVKIELLNDAPGVYKMKDNVGKVIYVGKAKSLIDRVKQYFYRPQIGKVRRMVNEIADFDTIQTNSEKEALLLELNLIRKYYPKYNILLKDGKTYPYISLSKEKEPLLKIAYKPEDNNHYYFGPYTTTSAAYKIIDLLNKIFPLRKCNHIPSSPCLYYHLHQCLGPCVNKDLGNQYEAMVKEIKDFMSGEDQSIKNKLHAEMVYYAENLNFERAQEIKDILSAIKHVQEKQAITLNNKEEFDAIATSSREGYFSLCIMTYRRGLLLGKNVYVLEKDEVDNDEQIESLIFQYYQKHEIPKEIILGNENIASSLSDVYQKKIIVPHQGKKRDFLLIALENAKNGLDEHFLSARLDDDNLQLLERLGSLLGIKTPLRIELFDNSHLQGSEPIGAMVVFINGEKAPSMYRKYNISFSDGKDDLKSMYEVILRRYSRLKKENASFPDLIIVDGGRNQIKVAKEAINDAGVAIPIAGLAKDNHHHTSMLLLDDKEISLDSKDKLFLLLVRMQDEVHRYAISFHRQKRNKKMTKTFFDDIAGIGDKRKEMLLKAYPSLEALLDASEDELSQIVPRIIAKAIKDKLDKIEYY